ncbi:helix-turn-helix domain-containing protein [Bradyrhizobium sp. TM239]|uniref:helix-turn-helix domain-containing protein n=1 Tax=Bradyrhizobium sp. TM239 TaxID=2599802 RepID=UPI0027D4DE4A|nr:helix-turn-helix transcriptional regulator [Bradyrhizobium sp. TM239]
MLTVTNQIKAARALLGWNQLELCKQAGVSISTIRRLEASDGSIEAHYDTVTKVCSALERAGVSFIDGPNYGVRLTIAKPQ